MRHVIKGPKGLYFTGMTLVGEGEAHVAGQVVKTQKYRPEFTGASPDHACKYEKKSDAQGVLDDKDGLFGGKDAFAGCTIERTEVPPPIGADD